ncbi:MAG: hypothetical protein KF894_23035 [Labilithrix sp.]|nr:hypothetical protein [Labilithrix sp.]
MSHRASLKRTVVAALAASCALPLAGCHRSQEYEATVEVTRLSAARKDETGRTTSADVELNYVDCPGTQTDVVRGGSEFSACVGKLKVGDRVKVKLEHRWDAAGHYTFDVLDIAGCPRVPDPNDEASFKIIRECSDWRVNGAAVGFQCNYEDKADLTKACPWFRKR